MPHGKKYKLIVNGTLATRGTKAAGGGLSPPLGTYNSLRGMLTRKNTKYRPRKPLRLRGYLGFV